MKPFLILLMGLSVLAGCANATPSVPSVPSSPDHVELGSDWLTYHDPQDRFLIRYPADWLQTDATTEVQFWDNLEDGVNSVKLALVEETRTNEEIQSQPPEDAGPSFERTFSTEAVDGHSVMVEVGQSDLVDYRIYYFDLSDGTRLAFVAWMHDDNEAIRKDTLSVQKSFQWVEGTSRKE